MFGSKIESFINVRSVFLDGHRFGIRVRMLEEFRVEVRPVSFVPVQNSSSLGRFRNEIMFESDEDR